MKQEPNPVSLAMEALLRKELAVLGDRLSKATLECQTLRFERDELYQVGKGMFVSTPVALRELSEFEVGAAGVGTQDDTYTMLPSWC